MNFLALPSKKPSYAQAKAVILPIPCGGVTPKDLALDKGAGGDSPSLPYAFHL
jgi:hypothetical protein